MHDKQIKKIQVMSSQPRPAILSDQNPSCSIKAVSEDMSQELGCMKIAERIAQSIIPGQGTNVENPAFKRSKLLDSPNIKSSKSN
jgi:hypothetical protein